MAGIEIAELKDALAYSEYQLSKTQAEKETLQKDAATHMFTIKEKEDMLKKVHNEKDELERDMQRQQTKVDMIEKN